MLPAWFKRWRRAVEMPGGLPYRLECECGNILAGRRTETTQEITCGRCQVRHLVFPMSPLVDLRQTIRRRLEGVPAEEKPAARPHSPWRKPALAAGGTLLVVVALFAIVLNSSWFRSKQSVDALAKAKVSAEIKAARQALAESAFAAAAERFRKARLDGGGQLSDRERRWLEQMEKEASLTAELSSESVGEILQLATGLSDQAWHDRFRGRYQNRPIIFDTLVHSAGGGVHRFEFNAFAGGHPVRIEVEGSSLLRALPIEWPARLVVGGRLADARRDSRGNWLVSFDPRSLVLFTDASFFRDSAVPPNEDLQEILRYQSVLLDLNEP